MSVNLSPLGGAAAQFFNNDGVPLAGGLIYTYLAGTNTPAATYTTSAGSIPHSNPIVLDSAGRVPGGEIWLANGASYKFILRDSAGTLIGTYDNILGINDTGFTKIANFTGDGNQIAFTLPISVTSENLINIFINGVYQFKNTFSLSGATITFSAPPPFTSLIEVEY
jgi:hypothetical protein